MVRGSNIHNTYSFFQPTYITYLAMMKTNVKKKKHTKYIHMLRKEATMACLNVASLGWRSC